MHPNTPELIEEAYEGERELPMLAGLAEFFHWWEEFLNIVNGPVLMFGAGIALVDLLTDGRLTSAYVVLLFVWAVSQALGIDTQLLGSFARARHKHGWERVGWLIVGVVLGVATWQAGDVYAIQQSEHITEAAALAQLGMPRLVWLGWRTFLAVALVALNGWTRYRAPIARHASAADADAEAAQLRRELELEPLRAAVRQNKLAGWRGAAATIVNGHGIELPPTPPTGPGTPIVASRAAKAEADTGADSTETTSAPATPAKPRRPRKVTSSPKITPLRAVTSAGVRHRVSDAEVERRVRAAWNAAPLREGKGRLSNTALSRNAGVSAASASKWVNVLKREDALAAAQRAQ